MHRYSYEVSILFTGAVEEENSRKYLAKVGISIVVQMISSVEQGPDQSRLNFCSVMLRYLYIGTS